MSSVLLMTLCSGTGLITQVPSLNSVLTSWSGYHLLYNRLRLKAVEFCT